MLRSIKLLTHLAKDLHLDRSLTFTPHFHSQFRHSADILLNKPPSHSGLISKRETRMSNNKCITYIFL